MHITQTKPDELIIQLIIKPAWCVSMSTVSLDQYSLCSHSEWPLVELLPHYFWAQSEWVGLGHPASLSQHFFSIMGLASDTLTATAFYPATTEEGIQFLRDYYHDPQPVGELLGEIVQCKPNCDHLHCERLHISKGNVVQTLSAAHSWAFVWFSYGNSGSSGEIHRFA